MMEKPSYLSLTQYFKKEASKEVIDEVTSWKESHKEDFKELQSIWEEYGSLATSYQPDLSAAWSKIDERTRQSNTKHWVFRLAAMIVLTIGIGWIIQSYWVASVTSLRYYQATNENRIIVLEDESIVTLSPGSSMSLAESFGSKNREIALVGKAFFEIERNESIPFKVHVDSMKISVLGTAFEVAQNSRSIKVTVVEGKVAVKVANDETELNENEKVIFNSSTKTLIKSSQINENHLAWKSLVLSFSNTILKDFASDLEDFYNVKIEIDEKLQNRQITATFNNQSLLEVFEVVQATLGVKVDTLSNDHFKVE